MLNGEECVPHARRRVPRGVDHHIEAAGGDQFLGIVDHEGRTFAIGLGK